MERAVANLQKKGVKIELKKDTTFRSYYRHTSEHCDYVLHLPDGRFDVGLKKQNDGSYALRFDPMGDVGRSIGATADACNMYDERAQVGRFVQEYAACAAELKAHRQGLLTRRIEQDGKIKVIAEV